MSCICCLLNYIWSKIKILEKFNLGQLFIGYTVLAIGTSLPEIAASVSLALKGRYETVSGTLIGSNIFNGLCVLAIPGLFMREEMSEGWSYFEWSVITIYTVCNYFCLRLIYFFSYKERKECQHIIKYAFLKFILCFTLLRLLDKFTI